MDSVDFGLEWDEAKRADNLKKHGLDFALVEELNWDLAVTRDQDHETEDRHETTAPIGWDIYVLVWTDRPPNLRVISFRKATSMEAKRYVKKIQV